MSPLSPAPVLLIHLLRNPVPIVLALLSSTSCAALASALLLFGGDSLFVQCLLLSAALAIVAIALLAVAALGWISFGYLKREGPIGRRALVRSAIGMAFFLLEYIRRLGGRQAES